MAQLSPPPPTERWNSTQTRAQYCAIARLRWRILVNGFRRKGGTGDLVARIITIPIYVGFLLGPTVGAGFGAWLLTSHGHLNYISLLLMAIFLFSQLLSINLGQPGTTFDPTELIRFPMRLRSYVTIRLFFGLLAPANVVATAMSLAAAVGIIIAVPRIWLITLLAMLAFAATNVLFTRMIFAWIDRWMSTRRAREVFTALVFTISIGFQYLNVTFNPAYNRHHHGHQNVSTQRIDLAIRLYHRAQPLLDALPPGLVGNSLVAANDGHIAPALLQVASCLLFAAAFLCVFALRMRTEFHGENLSDAANGVANIAKPRTTPTTFAPSTSPLTPAKPERSVLGLSPVVSALVGKEFLYLRRNSGMFYGMIAPLAMVLIFAGRLATRNNSWWIFPASLAYTMIGLAPLAYNSFGLEGAGSQFFFLAPIRMRDVFLAKNTLTFFMALIEGLAVGIIISYLGEPPTRQMVVIAILWTIGTLLINVTIGNYRSVSSPKKINLNRTANKQASPLSALLSVGLLLVAAGFGAGLLVAGRYFDKTWVLVPIMLVYAGTGLGVYLAGLRSMDQYALDRREAMFEELCKN